MTSYVYNHYNKSTGDIFYIGIGTGKNFYRSRNFKARSKNWHIYTDGLDFGISITHKDICFEEAKSIEKYLIAFYGRKLDGGILINITKGGDGCLGRPMSEEHKKQLSVLSKIRSKGNKYNLGKKRTDESKMKMSKAHTGKIVSDETKKRMSESKTGLKRKSSPRGPRPEEYKQKMREINKGLGLGRKLTDEHRANIGKASTGRRQTPESIAKAKLTRYGAKNNEI